MRFELVAGALCLDFANTIHDTRAEDKGEELRGIEDVLLWAKEAGLLSSNDHKRFVAKYDRNRHEAMATLAKCIGIRDLLLKVFAGIANSRGPRSQHLSELNSALAQMPALLQVRTSSGAVEKEWSSSAHGLQQVLFPVMIDAADLLTSDRLGRVRECASGDCTWLFVDESRNHSRRWCDMTTCGNRMKARRHYERTKPTH